MAAAVGAPRQPTLNTVLASGSGTSSIGSPIEQPLIAAQTELEGLLNKLKETASHVTVCHAQIDLLFSRCSMLVEALVLDGLLMEHTALVEATEVIKTLIQRIHAKLLQFAIYGLAKSVVLREEISGYLETFNVQLDECLFSFQKSNHEHLYEWRHDVQDAKEADEQEVCELVIDILNDPAKVKTITMMGSEAVENLCNIIELALLNGHLKVQQSQLLQLKLNMLRPMTGKKPAAGIEPPEYEHDHEGPPTH